MNSIRVGIAGLGTVGAGVATLLAENREILAARTGKDIRVVAVSARDKNKKRGCDLQAVEWVDDPVALASRDDVDIVVELMGGSEGAAKTLVEAALEKRKPIVCANKALIAHHGLQLAKVAEQNATPLMFEAAVAGGIPIVKALREGLAANRITRIAGILNGTCNYILTTMAREGRDFADVLADAQKLGYAEADPSFDIDGVDTAHKLAILASLAYGAAPNIKNVSIEGIRTISVQDIRFAAELGYVIKLLGIANYASGYEETKRNHNDSLAERREESAGVIIPKEQAHPQILQRVYPCLVPKDAPIATVDGAFNGVAVTADAVGDMFFEGRGAGALPTASAVIADIVDIARGKVPPAFGMPAHKLACSSGAANVRIGAHYLRLTVLDKPGVLADVTSIFKDHHISMKSFLQRSREPNAPVDIVITTHEVADSAMQQALAKIAALDTVLTPPHHIRIEEL